MEHIPYPKGSWGGQIQNYTCYKNCVTLPPHDSVMLILPPLKMRGLSQKGHVFFFFHSHDSCRTSMYHKCSMYSISTYIDPIQKSTKCRNTYSNIFYTCTLWDTMKFFANLKCSSYKYSIQYTSSFSQSPLLALASATRLLPLSRISKDRPRSPDSKLCWQCNCRRSLSSKCGTGADSFAKTSFSPQ